MATETSVKNKSKTKIKEPKKYKVVMYNDDFTPMDFVVDILVHIFHKSNDEAVNLMLNIHKGTKAVVGIYSYDIAKTKAEQSMSLAREAGHPFRVKVKPYS